ncbi:phosphoribosylaminoimidazole carboxylase [Pholiota molesta]|nr:phosphoribosylaminoimidazole carboxylase [Pholiota molesta]
MSEKIVGILGEREGRPVGRMLGASASLLNIKVIILDAGDNGPAKQILAPQAPHLAHMMDLDVLTVEIEHVDADALASIQSSASVGKKLEIHPSPSTIRIIQDKYRQKQHLAAGGLPVSEFIEVESSVESGRTLAYDGRGNFVLRDLSQAQEAIAALGNRPLYAEKWVPFTKEIAVMVVRTVDGEVQSYPVVETVHKDNICHLVFAPVRSRDASLSQRARSIAENAIKTFTGAGIFGVEMFLMEDGNIFINEIAPRPHNSGHYTIEACETSQYENHLRAILSLPLGSTAMKIPSSVMLNLIGYSSNMSEITKITMPLSPKGRKMGHITIVADSDAQLRSRLRPLLQALPDASAAEVDRYAPAAPAPGSGFADPNPLVGIIMGSDSDLPVMLPAARILDQFKVPYELTIVSAHRTPDRMVEYARSAATRGIRTIIAGAGGAAHLPGMVAALTALPVIGVPVKGSTLDGVDSLHSIVQMPCRGIPVATVAINNGVNAGLLAVRILSAGIPSLIGAMEQYMKAMEEEVLGKVEKLKEVGWEDYQVKRT